MRERVDLKSPVREYRPPGSVRGAPGNRCPYLDKAEIKIPQKATKGTEKDQEVQKEKTEGQI
jgi:hypothetical protein